MDDLPGPYSAQLLNWFTLRSYGFSDAAEIFVFISGYSIGFSYGPAVKANQFLAAAKRLWTRASQLYVAHILLFLFFTAQIARTAARFDNPMYKDQFNVAQFLDRADVMIGQALLLTYKPVNLDVLPLYIVLMLTAPAVLWGLLRGPNWPLLCSAVLYFAARHFDWNLPSFPDGKWYFNPFAWQFLFVFGAWCGFGDPSKDSSTVPPGYNSRCGMARVCVPDCDDMARANVGAICAAGANLRDLSHRQAQS